VKKIAFFPVLFKSGKSKKENQPGTPWQMENANNNDSG